MSGQAEVQLWVYARPDINESVATRHAGIVERMMGVGAPLGWRGLEAPPVPVRRKGSMLSSYCASYPTGELKHFATYQIRDLRYLDDLAADDDKFAILLSPVTQSSKIREILHVHFPEVIIAVEGYRAAAYFDSFGLQFSKQHDRERSTLKACGGVDIDGRNNIFTLEAAQYWDAELCGKALGYGPDEVIRRLDGQVPLVRPLMDGVYIVFNDDPDLSFEDFCVFNDRFKQVLGLV